MIDVRSSRALRGRLLSASALASMLSLAPLALQAGPLPSGGHYVAGKGEIGKSGQSLTVKQSSTTGIIDWNSFSIGTKNTVIFDNGSGATLNRVTGGNLSTIAGALHATGSLYLMNAQGVIISGSGRVVTGGSFVATGGTLSNSAFDDNQLKLKRPKGAVIDRGRIISAGGVTLVGSDADDAGTIHASQITLRANDKLHVSGNVAARNADGSGGTVVATARKIDVTSQANISASGTRGGMVLIGGDVHGGAIAADDFVRQSVVDAQSTIVAKGARISADAGKGAGGNIVIWSDGHTSFNGEISAKGQTAGGFAEVSSHKLLGFTGTVNLTTTHGTTGTLLLDPENVTISPGISVTETDTGNVFSPTGDNSVISVHTLEVALETANIEVTTGSTGSQAGDITVAGGISWSNNTLTLDAYHSIYIDATMSVTGSSASNELVLKTNDGGTGGDYSFNKGGHVSFGNTAGSLEINGETFTLVDSLAGIFAVLKSDPTNTNFALGQSYNAGGDTTYENNALAALTGIFTGTFEGLGNTISNLTISDTSGTLVGLFPEIGTGAVVRDLGLVNVDVSGGPSSYVGAIVGENAGGTLTNDYVTGAVTTSGTSAGGLVGWNNAGTVANSNMAGTVSGGNDGVIGGLVGYSDGTITGSYATGTVTAGDDASAGGLLGFGYYGTQGSVVNGDYSNARVTAGGESNGGGLVGDDSQFGTSIANSYATGKVSGGSSANVGGLVGYTYGPVGDSYSTGSVTGGSHADVGGFVGYVGADGSVDESYSIGAAKGGTGAHVGGFAGDNTGALGGTTAVYFDKSQNSESAVGEGNGLAHGAARSDADMRAVSKFSGWTFGTTPGAAGWVLIDTNGTPNNLSSVAGGTTPMLLSEYSSIVDNAHQLALMILAPGTTYTLAGDIDASATAGGDVWSTAGFDPIPEFTGTLNGVDHAINDLFIRSASGAASLFEELSGASTVEYLGLTNVNITSAITTSGLAYVAPLAAAGEGTVNDVYATGKVGAVASGSEAFAGGLVAENGGSIDDSYSSVSLNLPIVAVTGGLVGANFGTIEGSHATGAVSVTGAASADDREGGLVGVNEGGSGPAAITDSYATGAVSGTALLLGGFVGENVNNGTTATISGSYATGAVKGTDQSEVGGFVGANAATISSSYSTGSVSAPNNSFAGGFVANNAGTITQSYATGAVSTGAATGTSPPIAGGFVGLNDSGGTIDQSYSIGKVTGGSAADVGGFAGANTAALGGTTEDFYDATRNTGLGIGGPSGGTANNVGGLTDTAMRTASSFTGWTFGTTGGAAGWVIVDIDGSLNNSAAATGGTTPMLLSEYSNDIANAHQLQLMVLNLTTDYILSSDVDASLTKSGDVWNSAGFAPVGGNGAINFTGSLNGQGYAIDGLYVNSIQRETGLFGIVGSGGAVENVGLTDAKIAGAAPSGSYVGGLAGFNIGVLSSDYVTGSVSGGIVAVVGGLVGDNNDEVIASYSTAKVSDSGSDATLGGLAGQNGNANAEIIESFATGAVTGTGAEYVGGFIGQADAGEIVASYAAGPVSNTGGGKVGGFAGYNDALLTQSYSLGDVKGGSGDVVGGFVGEDASINKITHDYWDTQTSGTSKGVGQNDNVGTNAPNLRAETTHSLQTAPAAGLSAQYWVIVAGTSFPYLKWQVSSGTPEVVSGTIGGSANVGISVGVSVNGNTSTLVSMASGANGYYYELLAPGSIAGDDVLAYETSGGNHANVFDQGATGSLTGFNLAANTLTVDSAATSTSHLIAAMEMALGSNSGSDFLYTSTGGFTSGIDLDLDLSASSFSIDSAIDVGSGELVLVAKGKITESSAGDIGAKTLTGSSVGSAVMKSATNTITDLGAFAAGSTFKLTDDHGLTVDGAVSTGTGTLDITTVGSNHNLAIDSAVTGGTINLATTGEASEDSTGAITASLLNVTANTGIKLTSTKNNIIKLGTHTTNSGKDKVTL